MKVKREAGQHTGIRVRQQLKRTLSMFLAILMVLTGINFGTEGLTVTAKAAALNSNLLSDPGGESVGNGISLTSNGWSGASQGISAHSVNDFTTSINLEKSMYGKDITSAMSVVPKSGNYYMGFATTIEASIGSEPYSCYQDIDVSANATDIDKDTMLFNLSGWLCATGGNTATITLTQLDASKNVVTTANYSRNITSSTWTQVTLSGAINTGVRYLEVTMKGTHSACGLAAFDDLSLKISSNIDASPVLGSLSNQTMVSGTTLGPLNFSVSDVDTDFGSLTVSATSSNTSLIPNANISAALSNGTGTLNISSQSGQTGQSTITVSVSDGIKSTTINFVVTVMPDVQLDTNLILNGTGVNLAGWTDESSRFYSSGGAFTYSYSAGYYMYQDINIGKFATLIDTGFLTYSASADLSSNGVMQVIFKDAYGSIISTKSGTSTALIPSGTRSVRVNVGGNPGCSIDNVSFKVNSTGLPKSSAIANQTVNSGGNTGNLSFTVGYVGNASITATSSNSAVVPNSGISLGGSGYQRTICITPVTGVAGTSTITISVNGTAVSSFTVEEIVVATGLTVTAAGNATSMLMKDSMQMSAAVIPSAAIMPDIQWSVQDGTGSAAISNAGILTGIRGGTVTVRATSKDDSNVYGSMEITIIATPVSGITVTADNNRTSIQNEETLQMSAEVLPSDAVNKKVGWTVVDETGSATISDTGLLTATDVGTVTANATAEDGSGVVGTLQITITPIPVSTIVVSGTDDATTVETGKTMQMSAAVEPSNATDHSVAWSVVDGTGSATISDTGLLTATAAGTVTVEATANDGTGISGILPITISDALVSITNQPQDAMLTYGYTASPELQVAAERVDGVTAAVSYQWYRVFEDPNSKDEMIAGANSSSYIVESGLDAGTYRYDCLISCGGYSVSSNNVLVTVNKASSSMVNSTYGNHYYYTGNAVTAPVKADFTRSRDVDLTFSWYLGDSVTEANRLEAAPIEPGVYTLKADMPATANYEAASDTVKVTIDYFNPSDEAVLSGTLGENGWYISDVTVTAPSGYEIATSKGSSATWGNTLTIDNDQSGDYSYYLKQTGTGYITAANTVTIQRDTTKPEMGELTYSDHRSFLDWLFQREKIDIKVPVSDTISGADYIACQLTPDESQVQTPENATEPLKKINVDEDGVAVITVEKNFVGKIAIKAYDKAGNISETKEISKIAVEDTAPTLTVTDGTDEFTDNWYTTAQTLHISAADAESGILSVTCAVDNGNADTLFLASDTDTGLTTNKSGLTVNALEGTHTYTITVTDNALNTVTKTMTIRQDTVAPVLNYVISQGSSKVTDTTADIRLTASESGSFYYLVQDNDTEPTMEDLFATQAHEMTTGKQNTISLSGLKCNTEYNIYIVAKDEAGNKTTTMTQLPMATIKTSLTSATIALTKGSQDLEEDGFIYDGTSQRPDISVSANGTALDTDQYTISYSNTNGGSGNTTDAGTVTVTVTAEDDSDYTGTVSATYVIAKKTVEVTAANLTKQYGQTNPELILQPIADGQLIGADTVDDLHITLSTIAGTASEAGNYDITGTANSKNYAVTVKSGTLTITKIDAALSVGTTAITKTNGERAFAIGALTTGTASLSYVSSNTAVATVNAGIVTIKGIGITTITVFATGSSYNTATKTITITVKPSVVKTSSLKASGSKKLKLSWKKDSKVSGYQIAYSTSNKFTAKTTKTVTVNSYKTLSKTISKLKSGKKYYVHIRSYKSVGKTKIYADWSKTASVKVK